MTTNSLKYALVAGAADPGANDDSKKGYDVPAIRENTETGVVSILRDNTPGGAKWNALGFWQHIGYVAGKFYPPSWTIQAAGSTGTTNTMRAHLGFVPERVTISDLGAKIVTAVASTNIQLAVYSVHPISKLPYKLLGNTGDISAAATGQVSGPLASNATLEPGWYYFVCSASAASISLTIMASTLQFFMSLYGGAITDTIMGNASIPAGITAPQTYGTWPSDASGLTWSLSTSIPAVIFKVASVP